MQQEALRRRIQTRLDQLRVGPVAAATKVGLPRDYISDFLNGKKETLKHDKLPKVAEALHWSREQLLGEQKSHPKVKARGDANSDLQYIPEIDIRAGASYGGGTPETEVLVGEDGVSGHSVRSEWGFPAPFLRSELGVRAGRVHILPIRGDSMETTLYEGDRAVIDLDDTDASQGGIFAVLDDIGSVIIKQVEIVRGAEQPTIRCKSRNPNYEAFELVLREPVRIIGRVACRITRL